MIAQSKPRRAVQAPVISIRLVPPERDRELMLERALEILARAGREARTKATRPPP